MTDLNLNFDTGIKSISMGSSTNDNIIIDNKKDNTSSEGNTKKDITSPNLSVSDPVGIEFLAKGTNQPSTTSNDNSPKSTKSEEFNFFKPSEPEPEKKTIDTSNDDIISNPKNDNSEFKPIHRLTPQDIKNEKIDLLYKFKKLESQGIHHKN